MDSLSKYLGVLLDPDTLPGALTLLVFAVVVGLVLSAFWRLGSRKLLEKDTDQRIDRLAATFFVRLGNVILWLVVFTIYAHVVPALDRLGNVLLAGVSIAGVVIGIAAQPTLGNLIAGVSLIFYKPFRLGDRIQIMTSNGIQAGTVETVTLGFTFLRTDDNRRIALSNSLVSGQIIINLTMVEARMISTIPFSIGYRSDIDKARAIALDLARDSGHADDVVDCPVVALGPSGVDMALRVWCANSAAAEKLKNALLEFDQKAIRTGRYRDPVRLSERDSPQA